MQKVSNKGTKEVKPIKVKMEFKQDKSGLFVPPQYIKHGQQNKISKRP